jgi:hypothetical protein
VTDHRHVDEADKWLRVLLPAHLAASLLHFSHNAQYLDSYPNLPHWITRPGVYGVWLAMSTVGVLAWLSYARRRSELGLIVLGLYAAFGMGGLLHYARAPIAVHTAAMNFTILLESCTALALLAATIAAGLRRSGLRSGPGG